MCKEGRVKLCTRPWDHSPGPPSHQSKNRINKVQPWGWETGRGRAPGAPTPTAHIQCCQVSPTCGPDPPVQSPQCPSLHEPGRAPVQLLEVAIRLKAVVASIGHHHVAIRGQCQALWPIQWLCRCVDVRQEGAGAVKHLQNEWRMRKRMIKPMR